jgi:hypothetical protein
MSTYYEAPHFAVFSTNLSLDSFSVLMLSSAPSSQTVNLCASINVRDQVSHPYKTTGKIIVLYILILKVFRQQTRRQKGLTWMTARITQIHSPHNFLLSQVLICYCRSKIFELYRIFKDSDSYFYVIIFPCILETKHQHTVKILFWLKTGFGFMTVFIIHFDTACGSSLQFIITHTHTHTIMFTVTYSLPLLCSGFQLQTVSFFWVSQLSLASATSFSQQRLKPSSFLTNSLTHQRTDLFCLYHLGTDHTENTVHLLLFIGRWLITIVVCRAITLQRL